MSVKKRQLALNLFVTRHGHHPGAWRDASTPGGGNPDFAELARTVQLAERGKFDAAFFADFVGQGGPRTEWVGRSPPSFTGFEPLTAVAALAAVTRNIGLVATVNTNFNEPFNLARRLASLDHLSGGRVGWNVVSQLPEGAVQAFGVDNVIEHAARYERAGEFIDVSKKLWDSWDDGAFDRPDKASGVYADGRSVHPTHYHGKYYKVDAILDVARPVQGYPVFFQAGNSETGREFAAKYAEAIYAAAQTLEEAQAYYADVKRRLAKYGREEDHLKVLPGLSFAIGRSKAEAEDKFAAVQALVDFNSRSINLGGHDLSGYPLDGPLPDLPEPDNGKGRWRQLVALARRENLTIRQLVLRFSVVRGHRVVTGAPTEIADQLEDWFVNKGADGYNLIPPLMPSSLVEFIDQVVPELQRRGIFRTEYEGKTFRENLGLPRPPSQHAVSTDIAAAE
ncbi:MAG: nitrilotriacetate monooxygenase [Methylocystaceae bacterium]|nr:MAG: nitrilotriacetate monooxygenase [Methylocystaceae bacterium]